MKSLFLATIILSSLFVGSLLSPPINVHAENSTSVSISSSSSTVSSGGSVTLNIHVSDTTSSPTEATGTVSLSDGTSGGAFNPSSCTLSAGTCTATYTSVITAPSSITINATYSGDSTHATSSSTISITVTKHTTNTVVVANQTSVNPAGSVLLSVTVSDTSSSSTNPTGTVTLSDGNAGGTFNATSCTLASGSCAGVYKLSSNSPSSITVTASYNGDTSHLPSSGIVSLSINVHGSSVTITPSNSTVNAGSVVTLNSTVTDTSNSQITPTGTLVFSDNSAGGTFSPTTCTLSSAKCTVSYTLSNGAPASVTISAAYSGDPSHASSTGNSPLTVHPLRSTSTTVTLSSPTLTSRTALPFSVLVADTLNKTKVPTGIVTLDDGNAGGTFNPPSCTLSSGNCTSSYTPSTSLQSTVTITGTYSGDSTHGPSHGSSQLSVTILHSTIVAIKPNQVVFVPGKIFQFNATVNDTSSSQTAPTGTISWTDGHSGGSFYPDTCTISTTICTTTYTSAINAPSSITVTATYSGDSTHSTSKGTSSLSSNGQGSQSSNNTSTNPPNPQPTSTISIPKWIKSNAKWWHDNTIDDSTFEQGIQYMIQQGIMKIPPTSQSDNGTSQAVPAWVKNDAGWWADGSITDDDFVKAIQYLIEQGIITV